MISSDSCGQLVAGNYDILVNEPAPSLKSILSDFLERFERYQLELLALANGAQKKCSYADEFRLLKGFSKSLKEDKANLKEGEQELNLRKNRYKDIIPFSHTRVVLNGSNLSGTDYINANYIKGPSGSGKAYIACQGPLASTLSDFWRMIWECGVSVVVMACNERESGEPKCELYWPEQVDSSETYGNIQVTLVKVRQICPDFLIRKLSVKLLEEVVCEPNNQAQAHTKEHHPPINRQQLATTNQQNANSTTTDNVSRTVSNTASNEEDKTLNSNCQPDAPQSEPLTKNVLSERTICQFHYTTWPDHGVPDSVEPILELVRLVRDVQPSEKKPILVHCSAGCGRTGTICCIDYVWGLLRHGKIDSNFDLCSIISEMRQQRMSMVQTLEQYILCHKAVATLFINQLNLIDSHVYENVDSVEDSDEHDEEEGDEDEDDEEGDRETFDEQNLGPVFI